MSGDKATGVPRPRASIEEYEQTALDIEQVILHDRSDETLLHPSADRHLLGEHNVIHPIIPFSDGIRVISIIGCIFKDGI
jgi:hypothetical protein